MEKRRRLRKRKTEKEKIEGEGRHKRIQAVSPLFFWKREKRDTKNE